MTVRAILIWTGLWLAIGGLIVFVSGKWPGTTWGWLLWCVAAPALFLVLEISAGGIASIFRRSPTHPTVRTPQTNRDERSPAKDVAKLQVDGE